VKISAGYCAGPSICDCGNAAGWDVFLGETLPPLATGYGDEEFARHAIDAAQQQCRHTRAAMLAALDSATGSD
jgi:hypothetical protein